MIPAMVIEAVDKIGSHRTGTLRNVSAGMIERVLGFEANCKDDPDKVVYSWGFTADGHECGIWDYKGSHTYGTFSTYGPDEVFQYLFGEDYV